MTPVVMSVMDICEQQHVDKHSVYEWARRDEDPLPLRLMDGRSRRAFVIVGEWLEWIGRNSRLFKEADDGREKSDAA